MDRKYIVLLKEFLKAIIAPFSNEIIIAILSIVLWYSTSFIFAGIYLVSNFLLRKKIKNLLKSPETKIKEFLHQFYLDKTTSKVITITQISILIIEKIENATAIYFKKEDKFYLSLIVGINLSLMFIRSSKPLFSDRDFESEAKNLGKNVLKRLFKNLSNKNKRIKNLSSKALITFNSSLSLLKSPNEELVQYFHENIRLYLNEKISMEKEFEEYLFEELNILNKNFSEATARRFKDESSFVIS